MLLIFLLFVTNSHVHVESTPNESEFSKNVENTVSKVNVDFIKLLHEDLKAEKNAIFSPLNIYTVLALLHLGATGTTRDELSAYLSLPSEESRSRETHYNLGKLLETIQQTDSANVTLANGIFVQKTISLKDSYSQATKDYYKIETQQLDFAKGGSEATDTVNKWVSSKTNNRIEKLFTSDISSATQCLLASALYFSASWTYCFSESATKNKKFNTGVKEIQVPTMAQSKKIPYLKNDALKFEAISLPYSSPDSVTGDFAMMIILPNEQHSLQALIAQLKPEQYQQTIQDLTIQRRQVDFQIPRMKFRWSDQINRQLIALGVRKIFDKPEFANLLIGENFKVSEIGHAAEIEVHENGTVASAVTYTIVRKTLPPKPIPFYADRPFLLSIYHKATGIVLFSGIVQNPSGDNA